MKLQFTILIKKKEEKVKLNKKKLEEHLKKFELSAGLNCKP